MYKEIIRHLCICSDTNNYICLPKFFSGSTLLWGDVCTKRLIQKPTIGMYEMVNPMGMLLISIGNGGQIDRRLLLRGTCLLFLTIETRVQGMFMTNLERNVYKHVPICINFLKIVNTCILILAYSNLLLFFAHGSPEINTTVQDVL